MEWHSIYFFLYNFFCNRFLLENFLSNTFIFLFYIFFLCFQGRIVLNLPSIEVLAEAAASPSRRAAVLHVLETTVIGWIKQIRVSIFHPSYLIMLYPQDLT